MKKKLHKQIFNHAHDLIFRKIHNHRLIYNACWEDPRIDRELLQIDNESHIVMLTSAGCNALDYLLDKPARICAIDVNPRQNALLELKLKMIATESYAALFAMFGVGRAEDYRQIYARIRDSLSKYAQEFWDRKIEYFDPASARQSFYFHGTSGNVAWFFKNYFFCVLKELREYVNQLMAATSLAEQQEIFEKIEPRFWNSMVRWLLRHPLFMAHLGVPRPQMDLIRRQYPGGLANYVRDSVRHVSTQIPVQDNYFWRVYITGSYTPECCPEYLREENFEKLRQLVNRVKTYNSTLTEFLICHPYAYTHYVLLDHQDWLAWHNPNALEDEWRQILKNSRPGTKIIMRSAGLSLDFLPAMVRERVRFYPEITEAMHKKDRVGTYGSLHLAEVLP